MKKIIIGVAGVLLIMLGSIGLANLNPPKPEHLQPSPSPSPVGPNYIGWKEFKNETYHYQIKHPHDWYFHEAGLNPPPPATIRISNQPEEKVNQPHVWVDIFVDQKNNQGLDAYPEIVSLVNQGHIARPLKVSQSEAVLIDHLGQDGDLASMFVLYKDYIFRLSWHGTRPDVRMHFKDKALAIIASLQFTD